MVRRPRTRRAIISKVGAEFLTQRQQDAANNVQGVPHPRGAILPSLRTKMIKVRPVVTRKEPR